MVSPFTLGLFAPLPLAMMIPFMATQSLAMGEAFGKSFQYGKRKISSMTNDEFNKLTFNDLMDQQTANIKSIIPKLHEQMADSKAMQEDIFREMTNLIPAFLNGLGAGATDVAKTLNEDFQDFLKNPGRAFDTTQQASPNQAPTQISHPGPTIQPITPPSAPSAQDARIQFRNKISNFTEYSLNQLLKTNLTNTERSMVLEKLQSMQPSTPSPVSIQKPLTSQQTAQKAYLTKVTDLQKDILTAKGALVNLQSPAMAKANSQVPASTNLAAAISRAKNTLGNKEKLLQNYITQSRNNLTLKSVANADWNNRIWKM